MHVAGYSLSRVCFVLWRWTVVGSAGEPGRSGFALTRRAARFAARCRLRTIRARRRAAAAAESFHAAPDKLAA